jgi:hypothetical protein
MLGSLRAALRRPFDIARDYLNGPLYARLDAGASSRPPDAAAQLSLAMTYRRMAHEGRLPPLAAVGFKAFSETDEDGILLYLFAILGTANRVAVEMCAGDGRECNSANLILNHGWDALLVDGDPNNISKAKRFYARHPNTWVRPPQIAHAWLTRGGVNDLIRRHGLEGEIDLFSLDMDGVDYWLWEALDAVSPRIVVVEYSDALGPERAASVPYSDDFRAQYLDGQPEFAGASLAAFVNLGRRKNYRLIGVNSLGFNAFFVRNDLGRELIPEVSVAACFGNRKTREGMRERGPRLHKMPWVDV